MIVSESEVRETTVLLGFNTDMVEKVIQLLHLLNSLNSHPFLSDKFALKGGTALNLFLLNMYRLSVDIDLNYIGQVEREKMLEEKEDIDQAIRAVCLREGFTIRHVPTEHAGGKWQLQYQRSSGLRGNLELDVNYMFRQPLWDIIHGTSHRLGHFIAHNIPLLDIHELAGGKLAALFARHQARDLFDVYQLLNLDSLDKDMLRIAFVVYGALNRKDWRTISIDDIHFDPDELQRMLLPLLNRNTLSKDNIQLWGTSLVHDCKERLAMVLPFSQVEYEFIDLILSKGEIQPALLTDDVILQQCILLHPMLQWKAKNVREHFGLDEV